MKLAKRPSLVLVLACLPLGAGGCIHMTVGMTAPVAKISAEAFNREADVELARAASPGQLKTAEGFLAADPENEILLEVVARGYIEYAFGFVEDEWESLPDDSKHAAQREELARRATILYDRALEYALHLLNKHDKRFKAAFEKDVASTEAEAAKLDKDAAPALLLAGMALGSGINLNRHDMGRVVELPKAIALVKAAYKLNPKYMNGAAPMTLGLIYAAQGKAMGGDPDAAKRYFEEAIAVSGGKYLMARVMMARYLGVVTQDREFFEKTLKEVLATPTTVYPEQRLANELAHRRAKRYLDRAEDFF